MNIAIIEWGTWKCAKDPKHAEARAKDTGARAARGASEAVRDAEIVILAVPYAAVDGGGKPSWLPGQDDSDTGEHEVELPAR